MSISASSTHRPSDSGGTTAIDRFLSAPVLTAEVAFLVAQMFQVLADPTRARIMYALTKGEHSVGDLAKIAEISPSAASHQLKHLRDQRAVKVRRVGTRIYYSVENAHIAALFREAMHHLVHVVYALPDHLEAQETGSAAVKAHG